MSEVLAPRVGLRVGGCGTVCITAPVKFSSEGSEYPISFRVSIVATTMFPSESKYGAEVRTLIGIRHCLVVTTWEAAPLQFIVS